MQLATVGNHELEYLTQQTKNLSNQELLLLMEHVVELLKQREATIPEHMTSDIADRLAQFRAAARTIGAEVAKSGLSEEELMAELEQDKAAAFREYYSGDDQ